MSKGCPHRARCLSDNLKLFTSYQTDGQQRKRICIYWLFKGGDLMSFSVNVTLRCKIKWKLSEQRFWNRIVASRSIGALNKMTAKFDFSAFIDSIHWRWVKVKPISKTFFSFDLKTHKITENCKISVYLTQISVSWTFIMSVCQPFIHKMITLSSTIVLKWQLW